MLVVSDRNLTLTHPSRTASFTLAGPHRFEGCLSGSAAHSGWGERRGVVCRVRRRSQQRGLPVAVGLDALHLPDSALPWIPVRNDWKSARGRKESRSASFLIFSIPAYPAAVAWRSASRARAARSSRRSGGETGIMRA